MAVRDNLLDLAVLALAATTHLAPCAAEAALAEGPHGAVAAEHRLASKAGVEILEAGGNAVDAAVAALLAVGVVNPSSAGLGGGGFMLVYMSEGRRVHALDFRETAPAAANRDLFMRNGRLDADAAKSGGLAVAVPAEPRGLALALERFGSRSFADVSAPAIRLAREGFPAEAHLVEALTRHKTELAKNDALANDLLRADGAVYAVGEKVRRQRLADTLELLAREGTEEFYTGTLADEIVAAVSASGGIMAKSDLAAYRPVERAPVEAAYRGSRVFGMPPPSSGGGTIAAALQVLAAYNIVDLEHGSATLLHLLAETGKAVFADRARYYGDPDKIVVPLDMLLSPVRARDIRRRFSASRALPASTYGSGPQPLDSGTSHVSVVDAAGNAVACTSSINTAFGAKLGVGGFVLNNTMDDFSLEPGVANTYGLVGSEANAVGSEKRPLSSMSPTIVLAEDGPRLVVGASGGPFIISATLQTLLGVLDFGLDIETAATVARVHHQWMPDVLWLESRAGKDLAASLARRGHVVRSVSSIAAVQGVEIVSGSGGRRVVASSDARKGAVPAAY